MHGSIIDTLIAALSAEPETIAEYRSAIERYIEVESDWGIFHGFVSGETLEPVDAGIIVIDLPSRVIGYDTTYSIPSLQGRVKVSSKFVDEQEGDIYVPYKLPSDWKAVESIPVFEGARSTYREKRLAQLSFDTRPILYGRPLFSHIVRSIQIERATDRDDAFTNVHATWLMTVREDLRGKTPREILLEKMDFIDFDLHTRSMQWSFTKVRPKALSEDSFAFQIAGFGTNEWVVYYDLVRHLIWTCADRIATDRNSFETEVEYLRVECDRWMGSPNSELSGRVPNWIIGQERRRMNIEVSAHEALIDEDCPCCVAVSEMFDTPMIWNLDGCNMDDGFEFSHFRTREEWEEDQKRWEEFNVEFKQKLESDRPTDTAEPPF